MLSICSFLFEVWNWIKPNSSKDLIESVSAIIMVCIAYKALTVWRKEKKHDILLEAFAFRREAKAYLQIIRDPIGVSSHLNRETYEKRKAEKQVVVDKIQQITEKLNFTLDEADPLLHYYRIIGDFDIQFNTNIGMLDFYDKEIEEQINTGNAYSDFKTKYSQLHDSLYEVKLGFNEFDVPKDDVLKRLQELETEILLGIKS